MEHLKQNNINVFKIKISEIEKIDIAHCAEPKETLISYYNRQTNKPTLLSNGGFFAMSTGVPVFNLIDEGTVKSDNPMYRWGIGIPSDHKSIKYGCIDYNSNWTDFISGYPVLLDNGNKCDFNYAKNINYKANRTFIGYNDEYVFLGAIEGSGMTFQEMQDYLLKLGIKYAINLDGGGSTKILYKGDCVTNEFVNRPVDNVLAIYLKEEDNAVKTIYRVQTGAFKNEKSAITYRNKIRAIPDTIQAGYANAYVRFIDGIWKTQVGAYSVKANAERVVADLKNKGFESFITTK